ncbi:Hyccin protein [Dioscorea alata]|uniref:Hyccin protein n=1 Tax=Dioscorea alata TaxID=55571 RepID=A0ACB7WC97_DIOAL|nr:Hyccin protein [Dioscorea alata]
MRSSAAVPGETASPATSTTTSSSSDPQNPNNSSNSNQNPMQSWWESISRARTRIHALAALFVGPESSDLAALADSDRPARALLDSPAARTALSLALSHPSSGAGDDPLCQWLYDTLQSPDLDLRLVPLSFIPLVSGLYLSRVISGGGATPSLAGFEAVLLAIYSSEVKARAGRPVLISIPDLSLPSLYHTPRPNPNPNPHPKSRSAPPPPLPRPQPSVAVLSPPLEPQIAVKSTKRACIVGVALDTYYKKIAMMPSQSKIDLCEFVSSWAGQDCSCRFELDDDLGSSSSSSLSGQNFFDDNDEVGNASEEMHKMRIQERSNGHCGEDGEKSSRGSRVPLPWELLQPVLRILGHCILAPLNPQDVRDAASAAVRCVYARASHDLVPQAILATRSLIQLDKGARAAVKSAALAAAAAAVSGTGSNPNTPSKPKKPEVLLVSK